MFTYPFRLPFRHPFARAFSLDSVGKPPCYETVVAWFTGKTVSATAIKDLSSPQYPLEMYKAPCLLMDGVASITWSAPVTIVSTEGTSVYDPDVSDVPSAGTLYKITLDNGTIIPCSEVNGDKIYSSNYLIDGLYGTIVSADIPAVRSCLQNTYFAQNVDGFGFRENLLRYSNSLISGLWSNTLDGGLTQTDDYWKYKRISSGTLNHITDPRGYPALVYGDLDYTLLPMTPDFRQLLFVGEDTLGNWIYLSCYSRNVLTTAGAFGITYIEQGNGRGLIQLSINGEFDIKNFSLQFRNKSDVTILGTVVCLGDSISTVWPTHFARLFPTSAIVNSAVGGDRIDQMIARFQVDVADHNPDKIILIAGANNIGQGWALVDMQTDMLQLLSLCDDTGAETILGTMIPRTGYTTAQQQILIDFNAWLYTLGYTVVNQYDHMLEPGSITDLAQYYTTDGIHPAQYNSSNFMAEEFAKVFGFEYPKYIKTQDNTFDGTEYLPFLIDHKPNEFNQATTTYAFKERGVGNFDGLGDVVVLTQPIVISGNFVLRLELEAGAYVGSRILLAGDGFNNYISIDYINNDVSSIKLAGIFYVVPSGIMLNRSLTLSRVGGQLTITNGADSATFTVTTDDITLDIIGGVNGNPQYVGILRNISIATSAFERLIPLNDGELYGNTTTDIHDDQGNVVGNLVSADVPAFWRKTKAPYEVQQMDAGINYFVDTNGNSLPFTEETLDTLGAELINDPLFIDNIDNYIVTAGVTAGTKSAIIAVTAGVMEYLNDPLSILKAGVEYEISIDANRLTGTGDLVVSRLEGVNLSPIPPVDITSSGTTIFRYTPDINTEDIGIKRKSTGDYSWEILGFSIREVNQVINNNDKYFFGSVQPKKKELILHSDVLVEPCLSETKTRVGL